MDTYHKYFRILIIIILPVFFSCTNTKKVTYFNDLPDKEIEYNVQNLEPVIQKNDLLGIMVTSVNGDASQLFNLYTVSSGSSGSNVNAGTVTQTSGFLVDQEGFIQLPMLGLVKAAGLTKKQLKESITKSLVTNNILYDPVVNIRYLNYKVTVLGQVARPSVFNVPNEKITLLEALGLAGDLTIYGKRENVLVIREVEEGKRVSKHINLNSTDLLVSPYYYLKPNDIVYVAPNQTIVASASSPKLWLPSLLSALSIVAIVLTRN